MSEKSLSIPVQYVLYANTETLARPYELEDKVHNKVSLWVNVEPLPQENHWRVVVHAQVLGYDSQDNLVMTSAAAVEAIAVLTGFEQQEAAIGVLKASVGTSVVGSVRALLHSITLGTGLGSVTLPPLSAEQVAVLPAKENF